MTINRTIEVHGERGLHIRPAHKFVLTALNFDAKVRVFRQDDMSADGTSISELTMLGIGPDQSIRVEATGPQENEVVNALAALAANNFGFSEEPRFPYQHAPRPAYPRRIERNPRSETHSRHPAAQADAEWEARAREARETREVREREAREARERSERERVEQAPKQQPQPPPRQTRPNSAPSRQTRPTATRPNPPPAPPSRRR